MEAIGDHIVLNVEDEEKKGGILKSWKKIYRHMYATFLCAPMIAVGKGNPVPTATALIFE
ncbi:MAG: hypothetical protein PVH99_17355 [Desulfobacteraceae bacterium]|jgi:hypothetical protein